MFIEYFCARQYRFFRHNILILTSFSEKRLIRISYAEPFIFYFFRKPKWIQYTMILSKKSNKANILWMFELASVLAAKKTDKQITR